MTAIFEGTGTTTEAEVASFEPVESCDNTALTMHSQGVVRVVVSAQSEVIRATVDPLSAERKARIKALNAAIKSGYSEPTVSTR